MKSNPERIYLEPGEGAPDTGRLWCDHDAWDGDPDYADDPPATAYIRADLCRPQPRRVSEGEFHAALSDAFGLSAEAEDTDRAGRRFMDRLGIEITPTEDPWETIRQQMRKLGREVWVECLAAEGYAPTDRTPWAIPLSDMVRRHMDRLRSSVQPRRVMSRERLQEVFYWWADHPGDPPWEEVATRLGIDLTPTEESTDD